MFDARVYKKIRFDYDRKNSKYLGMVIRYAFAYLLRMDIFELELASVRMALESRPRNKSYKIDIELGSLSLRDKVSYNIFMMEEVTARANL